MCKTIFSLSVLFVFFSSLYIKCLVRKKHMGASQSAYVFFQAISHYRFHVSKNFQIYIEY